MASSFTGGISAPFNVLLNRGLNLLDATDPVACRQNISALAYGDLKTLTYGFGLNTGTFNPAIDGTISVDASATGTAGKVVKYDANGDLTVANKLNLSGGLSFLNREAGANGALQLRNTGTGLLKLDSAGTLQASADKALSLTTLENIIIGSYTGTSIQLTGVDGTTARTALSITSSSGYSGSKGLSVVGGSTLDTVAVSGATTCSSTLAVSGATTCSSTLAVSGATTCSSTLAVSGAATFSSGTISPQQPSWSWYKSTVSTTNTTGISPFGTAGFPLVPNKNVSVSAGGAVIPDVAGRYSVSFTGKITGSGSVQIALYSSITGVPVIETLFSGTGSASLLATTYIFDFGAGSGNYIIASYTATSGTITLTNLSFSGFMIG